MNLQVYFAVIECPACIMRTSRGFSIMKMVFDEKLFVMSLKRMNMLRKNDVEYEIILFVMCLIINLVNNSRRCWIMSDPVYLKLIV